MDTINTTTILNKLDIKRHSAFGKQFNGVLKQIIPFFSQRNRHTGEDYFQHGLEIAAVLKECSQDNSLLLIALLHDLYLHPDKEKILKLLKLKKPEREMIEDMHALRGLSIDSSIDDLEKFIDAFTKNYRLIPLRMAHRLNDIRHIDRFHRFRRRQIASETIHMYASFAGRLGLEDWRYEMEDSCFKILHPRIARQLIQNVEDYAVIDRISLKQTRRFLKKKLLAAKIPGEVNYRIKPLYSTYQKMVLKQIKFEDLTDRLAMTIIVKNRLDCYKALGIIHSVMHPMPEKIKDYIGAPKENGYQSIHTVVYPLPGVTEEPIEIQIRTESMDLQSKYGASHGDYKNYMYALNNGPSKAEFFFNLKSLHEENRSPKQFEKALVSYFKDGHIAIFDQANNLHHMKEPTAVIDFALMIKPNRFPFLRNANINGRTASLDSRLRNGDVVELIYGRSRNLEKEWLLFCYHPITRKQIKDLLAT